MSHLQDQPNLMEMPERPWAWDKETLKTFVMSNGITDPSQVENEIRNWASGEWVRVTHQAYARLKSEGRIECWAEVRARLKERHDSVWKEFSEA